MIKVCHMTSAHKPEDERIFFKECVSLAEAGYDTYIVARGNSYKKNGVHIIGIGDVAGGRFHRMLTVTRQIYEKALSIDAEIYHLHDPELLPFGVKLKNKGKKVIFDSHEHIANSILEKNYIPFPLRKVVQISYRQYQRYVCKKLDAIITATPNVTAFFKAEGCKNAIDLCNFPVLSKSFLKPDYASRTLAFAGGISSQWNHEHIIKAIEQVPNVCYKLCGNGEGTYFFELKKLAGWSKVDFIGVVPHEKVGNVLCSSSIGVSLLTPGANTDWENGNMANTKIFEEMMAGLPVICTNFRRWKEFIEKYDCGLCINPQDEKEIAEAIEFYLEHPKDAERMGNNGRKVVEQRFNWCVEKRKLLNLYTELSEAIK